MTALNIHQRLHAAMGEVDYIQKEKKQGMRYTIVSHDAVTAKVRPILHKHGVIYYPVNLSRHQDGNRTEIDLTVRFANVDKPEDHVDVVASGYGVDDQDKGPGKAISYAVKYCLLKALGLETGDDPDEVQDERAAHKPGNGGKPLTPAQEIAGTIAASLRSAQNVDELEKVWATRKTEMAKLPDVTRRWVETQYLNRKTAMTETP